MSCLSEFPVDAIGRVKAETLRAHIALEQEVSRLERMKREAPFLRCVLRIFLAFAREATQLAKTPDHPDWCDSELDPRCRSFLIEAMIESWESLGKDPGVRKMFSSRGWGYSIDEDVLRKITKFPEWKQYQTLLLEALDIQSVPLASVSQLPSGPASQVEPALAEPALPVPPSRPERRTAKRNPGAEAIDKALREIAKTCPKSHEEVFRAMNGRFPVPLASPFLTTGGWLSGFNRDPVPARAWLSRNWHRLQLPAFRRGPKKRPTAIR